ncbi:GyrI-like domain-containing protein [Kitasatospora sp. NPDC093550]|uniref:GyrI-like domain-containing protein n=1 Tax=Kitasatospora sp. NPDC093550 TaxID=3364089 RepID=UPI0037F830F9
MDSGLTAAELTLLGMLVEQPRHGYELEKVIAERGMREWTEIGFSSIYYLLTKLRRRGLIDQAAGSPPGGGKARQVYAATDAGRAACAAAAVEAIAVPHPLFPRVLVGLANQPAIEPEDLLAALDRRARALAERVEEVRRAASAAGASGAGAPGFVSAIFDYSMGQLEAEQAWLARYRASLDEARRPGRSTTVAPYDVKREQKEFYAPKNTAWNVVDVPEQQYIGIDGTGDPNTAPAYAAAVEALYAVAYTVKFASKGGADGGDFVVGPLEALWWSERPEVFTTREKDSWNWTALISMPAWITEETIEEAKRTALAKKKLPAVAEVRRLTLKEGLSAQVLHIGSYEDETPLMEELHQVFLEAEGLRPSGHHHEIYLGDPRRTAPEKLRTVVRQPVERVG